MIVILAGSIDAICGRVLARAGRYARRREICAQSARNAALWGLEGLAAFSGRSCGGEGDMRADGARRDMGDTDIKKTPYREI